MTPLLIAVLLLVLAVGLLLLSILLTPARQGSNDLSRGSRLFLVLLRLAIGWHFLVEGLDKLNDPTWSSAAYLREASGPLADYFRDLAGDNVLASYTLRPEDAGLPAALDRAWQQHLDHFSSYYELDEKQRVQALEILQRGKENTRNWLQHDKRLFQVPSVSKQTIDRTLTVPGRIEAYKSAVAKAAYIEANDLPKYDKGAQPRYKEAKKEAAWWRGELQQDLAKQTAAWTDELPKLLTNDQRLKGPLLPARPPYSSWGELEWSDFAVRWGLVVVGGCLLLGALTRLASVGGAVLLLMFFIAMPPLPYLPESPKAEGHYLYINKNIIEMLALLALATLPSGRWLGLDGLLSAWSARRSPRPPNTSV